MAKCDSIGNFHHGLIVMKHLAVKFCGFTNSKQLQSAVSLGIDAVGLVFYEKSPRYVSPVQAKSLIDIVPAFTSIVALVVNISEQQLIHLANELTFDIIQFHGDETAKQCQALAKKVNKRWIKAIRVNETDNQQTILQKIIELKQYGASSVLLDVYHPNKFGGTGQRFDWAVIPDNSPLPIILAGGLTPDNVIQTLSLPIAGVDVSGGIEYAKGQKDLLKMQAFLQALHR